MRMMTFQNPSHIFKHGLVGNVQVLHQSKLGFVPKHSTPLLLHVLEIYKQNKNQNIKKIKTEIFGGEQSLILNPIISQMTRESEVIWTAKDWEEGLEVMFSLNFL